jgi:hypothetical protein
LIAFRRGTLSALVAAAAITLASSPSSAEVAITSKERASLELRLLQTELMVAALGCSSADRYNAFVTRYQPQLVDGGKTMQNLFKRVHGGQAFNRVNTFVTQVANEVSLRMVQNTNQFCDQTDAMFQALLSGGSDSFERARSRFHCAPITGFAGCTVEAAATQEVADDEQATQAPTKAKAKAASRTR